MVAEHEVAPLSLSGDSSSLPVQLPQLGLSRLARNYIGLSCSSATSAGNEGACRLLNYIIPCYIPTSSKLADVIGKQALTMQYALRSTTEMGNQIIFTGLPGAEEEGIRRSKRENLMKDLEVSLTVDTATRQIGRAEEVYKIWIEQQEADTKEEGLSSRKQRRESLRPSILPKPFADKVLSLALPPGKPDLSVASGIVKDLIGRKAVSDSSLANGGLLAALLATREWTNILLALTVLKDIPESSLMAVLKARISLDSSKGKDSVSTGSPVPSLPALLSRLLRCPVTPVTLRSAIRAQMSLEELMPVIGILDVWLSEEPGEGDAKIVCFPGLQHVCSCFPPQLHQNSTLCLTGYSLPADSARCASRIHPPAVIITQHHPLTIQASCCSDLPLKIHPNSPRSSRSDQQGSSAAKFC